MKKALYFFSLPDFSHLCFCAEKEKEIIRDIF